MFKYFKAKRAEAQFKAALWGKAYEIVSNFPDIIDLVKKAKDMDTTELQKLIASELVNYVKANEENTNKTDGE